MPAFLYFYDNLYLIVKKKMTEKTKSQNSKKI